MFTEKDMQMMSQIKRALQMTAANLSPALAREVAMIYPAYQVGKDYAAGDYFTCGADANGDPVLYNVVQAHTSAAEWPPASTPSSIPPSAWTHPEGPCGLLPRAPPTLTTPATW